MYNFHAVYRPRTNKKDVEHADGKFSAPDWTEAVKIAEAEIPFISRRVGEPVELRLVMLDI